MQIWGWKRNELTGAAEQRRSAALLWFDQVDAAALVDADTKVDGGGRARVLRRREEEEGDEEKGGKCKGPSAVFIKTKG